MTLDEMNLAAIYRRVRTFVRHWTKEIVIALLLAIIAAVMIDPYLEEHKEQSAQEILSNNLKAIAVITVFDSKHDVIGQGSGFFYSSDGRLATNFHVVQETGISEIRAQLSATRAVYIAKGYIYRDRDSDIALLQFDARDTPHVQLGNV